MNDLESWEYYRRLVVAQLSDDKTDIQSLHLEMIEVKQYIAQLKTEFKIVGLIWSAALVIAGGIVNHYWK